MAYRARKPSTRSASRADQCEPARSSVRTAQYSKKVSTTSGCEPGSFCAVINR